MKMTEKRRFRRITYVVGGTLQCHGSTFSCRLENLSVAGALITIRDTSATDIRVGDHCFLRMYHEIEARHVIMEAYVIHHVFAFVGLAFTNLSAEIEASLVSIMKREKQPSFCTDDNDADYSLLRNVSNY
ncbi:MAG: hypothetical protein CXR30_18505 [Geobacter sp.]|nr:MAG: hypothetical protein CXR30_18505 [Geobacter sp.]